MPEKSTKEQLDILFIINPISGDNDKSEIKDTIRKYLSQHHYTLDFYYTTGENDAIKIGHLLDVKQIKKVVVVGGDGTCNMVGNLLLNKNIKMGIIPAGSANGLATELELPAKLEESLDCIVKGKSKKLDALKINKDYICLHLSDIGFNAKVIDRFEQGETRGMTGYANSFIGELVESKPSRFKLKYNEKEEVKTAFMIVIANATKFGTGAVINPKGKTDDSMFEIVVLNPQKVIHFLEMIVPFYTQKIHTLDFVDTYSCKKVIIENPERQNVQIDGENIGQPAEVTVEILPQALSVLVP